MIKVCLNCNDRTIGCHENCKKYIEDKKIHNEIMDKKKKSNNLKNLLYREKRW